MKTENKNTGRLGENLAVKELEGKGYEILERNFASKFGEIDIIAKDKSILVFVEVKTKKGEDFGLPEEMVGPGKLRKIRNMATIYMKGEILPCRLDVIAIVLASDNSLVRLTHYENVY
ncbi:MAG: YraN family protein [Patescibacteria group bacterium]|nr:YraN family protein [Patescibacteria group bacterium]MCL5432019.1 YraN family protein [Patescibacteria group bacterium]